MQNGGVHGIMGGIPFRRVRYWIEKLCLPLSDGFSG